MREDLMGETKMDEMLLEPMERRPQAARKPPLIVRLRLIGRGILRFLLPEAVVSAYCRFCWVELELVEDQIELLEGGYIVRHMHLWRCPTCEDRTIEHFVYMRELDIWDHF
jgi:hypothetical protein